MMSSHGLSIILQEKKDFRLLTCLLGPLDYNLQMQGWLAFKVYTIPVENFQSFRVFHFLMDSKTRRDWICTKKNYSLVVLALCLLQHYLHVSIILVEATSEVSVKF